jgi:SAM-dependent methyltransferase
MPDLEENAAYWDGGFHWRYGGDEWSRWWGSPEAQWRATIYPRVAEYLPVHRLVEIAPGYGRWTQFLRDHCEQLVAIDLSRKCIRACRKRFRGDRRLSFHVNDGRSLSAVDDGTADFVFSFDSLVHVEDDVMTGYIAEVARVLSPDGVAFLHHSNMAAYPAEEVGPRVPHWRSGSVSGRAVSDEASRVGLSCFKQELIQWGTDHEFFSDGLSWLTRVGSTHDREPQVFSNPGFMREAEDARELSSASAEGETLLVAQRGGAAVRERVVAIRERLQRRR